MAMEISNAYNNYSRSKSNRGVDIHSLLQGISIFDK